MVDKSIQEQIETTVREGERAYNKSKELLNIAKNSVEIAIEINEEAASNFIDIELQKFY